MALLKLKVAPAGDGYRVDPPDDAVITTKMAGGSSRQRQDIIGAASTVSARWMLDRAGYDYMMAFDSLTGEKGLPFLIDLIVEGSSLDEREAKWIRRPRLVSANNRVVFHVEATLEVKATPMTTAAATEIVEAYASGVPLGGALGGDGGNY